MTATVRSINGQLVLDDPEAAAVARVVEKHNLRGLLELNADRVKHFAHRAAELGRSPADVVIVLIAVDDPIGGSLADCLMPNHDWSAIRARGEAPIARGLAPRQGISDALAVFDAEAWQKLRDSADLSVVVIDRGVAEVFPAGEAL